MILEDGSGRLLLGSEYHHDFFTAMVLVVVLLNSSELVNELWIAIKTPPPLVSALSLRYTLKSHGNISEE